MSSSILVLARLHCYIPFLDGKLFLALWDSYVTSRSWVAVVIRLVTRILIPMQLATTVVCNTQNGVTSPKWLAISIVKAYSKYSDNLPWMSQIAIWSSFTTICLPCSFLSTFQDYRCFVFRDGCHVGPRISAAPGASVVSKAAPKVPQAKAVARAVPGDDSDVDAWQWEKPWYEVEKRCLKFRFLQSNHSSPRNNNHNNYIAIQNEKFIYSYFVIVAFQITNKKISERNQSLAWFQKILVSKDPGPHANHPELLGNRGRWHQLVFTASQSSSQERCSGTCRAQTRGGAELWELNGSVWRKTGSRKSFGFDRIGVSKGLKGWLMMMMMMMMMIGGNYVIDDAQHMIHDFSWTMQFVCLNVVCKSAEYMGHVWHFPQHQRETKSEGPR